MAKLGDRAVQDAASDWLVRFKSGEPTDADHAMFQQWLEEDAAHRRAYDSAAHTWQRLGVLENLHRTLGQPSLRARRWSARWRVAAAVALIAGIACASWPFNRDEPMP